MIVNPEKRDFNPIVISTLKIKHTTFCLDLNGLKIGLNISFINVAEPSVYF